MPHLCELSDLIPVKPGENNHVPLPETRVHTNELRVSLDCRLSRVFLTPPPQAEQAKENNDNPNNIPATHVGYKNI